MDLAIMIEGQNGLTWPRWQRLARLVEDLGFAGLYRSDHYTNGSPPDLESLELWVSLTWLAAHTQRLQFGPLVSPVSFRQPTMTARMAAAVDDLSGGRLTLGLGAGWQVREHHNYGWDLLEPGPRMARLQEALEIIARLLHAAAPVTLEGRFFQVRDAVLLPRPQRPGGPPILIGGNGPRRTLPLVAQYASEWNAVFTSRENLIKLNRQLDELLAHNGRGPAAVRRSFMSGVHFGRDDAEVRRVLGGRDRERLKDGGNLIGTAAECADQLARLAEVGVQRVMLQWLALDDLDRLEAMGRALVPLFSS
ncbi:MAG: TIGR03560 family F420-dependent LLM class oxidoreductase [Anaerolineales bacterium]|nr:TIGR03560 family F420-dependent LLM class oxidoreductase [Anaerolineales bacterium]